MKCDQFSHGNANEYQNSISIIIFFLPLPLSHSQTRKLFQYIYLFVIVTNCKSYITFILPSLSYFFPRSICLCVCVFASPVIFVRFLTIWQVIEATFKIDRNKYQCVCHWNRIYLFLLPSILYFWKCPPFSMCDAVFFFFHHLFFCSFACPIVTPSIILNFFPSMLAFSFFGWHSLMVCDMFMPVRILKTFYKC